MDEYVSIMDVGSGVSVSLIPTTPDPTSMMETYSSMLVISHNLDLFRNHKAFLRGRHKAERGILAMVLVAVGEEAREEWT
jgi:hypothetical protein